MTVTADPITTEVVRNFVISCAEDMNASLWRSAHSSVIYEGKDSAVALMDEHGNKFAARQHHANRYAQGLVSVFWVTLAIAFAIINAIAETGINRF